MKVIVTTKPPLPYGSNFKSNQINASLQGNTEQHQLTLIAQLCGAINEEVWQNQIFPITYLCQVWPGVSRLDLFEKLEIPRGSKRRVKERLKPYVKDQYACDLIDKLLSLDPSKRYQQSKNVDSSGSTVYPLSLNSCLTRLDADNALNHDLFWTDPMPCSLERMLANHNQSMFEYLAPTR